MLSEFRAGAGGIFAKLLLAVLVLSFAVWGIEDMLRRPSVGRNVATVGNTQISIESYQSAVRSETDMLRRSLGEQATPEIIKALQPEKRALQALVQRTLIKQEAQTLGIIPSDADIARQIHRNPNFQLNGKFDKARFSAVLENNQISEKAYIDRMRSDLTHALIMNTLAVPLPVSDIAVKTLYETRESQRGATVYLLNEKLVGTSPAPKPGEIEEYFTKHSATFTAPEQRSVSYVTVKPQEVQVPKTVSEEALLAAYQERIDEWKRPERREIDQLLFSSAEDAKKASEAIASGKTFDEVAKTSSILNAGNISLGKIERDRLISGADEVFTLPKGGVSKPVESAFGWHVFHVRNIEPAATAPLNEVRATLEKDVRQQLLEEAQTEYLHKIEDALAGGATLPEIAKEYKLPLQTVGSIVKGGGTKLPALDKFLETVFATQEKAESPVVASKGGVYYIVRVDSVTPERNRSLDEVRAAVTAAWQEEMRTLRLNDLAATIAQKFSDKKSRDAVIAQYRLSPVFTGALKRGSEKAGNIALPKPLLGELFSLPAEESTGLHPLAAGGFAIAVVGKPVALPPMDQKAAYEIRTALEDAMREEVVEAYFLYLEKKHKVEINQKLLAVANNQSGE